MNLVHTFDVAHAAKYGVHEAILISNMAFWIAKNKANDRHCHEGRTWAYNSVKAFTELFPYLSDKQIRRTLDSLIEQGVLVKGNFNDSRYDRTNWYAFADESMFLVGENAFAQKGKRELPKKANETCPNGQMIKGTDSKPDSKPDSKGARTARASSSAVCLKTWLQNIKAAGEKPVPEDDSIFEYADQVGIPIEFLRLCWAEFKDQYVNGGRSSKRYTDWRQTFRNAVRGNWFRLWALDAEGKAILTTQGRFAERRHEEKAA